MPKKKDWDHQTDDTDFDDLKDEINELEEQEIANDEEKLRLLESNKELEVQLEEFKQALARKQADYQNLVKRSERDRGEMIHFLTSDIVWKFLTHFDTLSRVIENTKDEHKESALYEWVVALSKWITKSLQDLWVNSFESIWEVSNPDYHEVLSQGPWKQDTVVNEFEKWYMLNDRVLRPAKVIVWNGQKKAT